MGEPVGRCTLEPGASAGHKFGHNRLGPFGIGEHIAFRRLIKRYTKFQVAGRRDRGMGTDGGCNLPREVIEKTAAKYQEALTRLTA